MIGIFDSGVGGLTVMRAIRDRLPSSDLVYFGDTARAPYGNRTRAELTRFSVEGFHRLMSEGATSIVSACNSVSGSLALSLLSLSSLRSENLIEMVAPTVREIAHTDHGRLLLVATAATIESGLYEGACSMMGIESRSHALPSLAGAIEAGLPEQEIENLIRTELPEELVSSSDTLVLACTHFPLVTHVFERIVGTRVHVVNPAVAVAKEVEERFWPREAGYGSMRILISKESDGMRAQLQRLFGEDTYELKVVE